MPSVKLRFPCRMSLLGRPRSSTEACGLLKKKKVRLLPAAAVGDYSGHEVPSLSRLKSRKRQSTTASKEIVSVKEGTVTGIGQ